MGIEEEFDIEIDNDEAEKISTVQDAVDQIKKSSRIKGKEEILSLAIGFGVRDSVAHPTVLFRPEQKSFR